MIKSTSYIHNFARSSHKAEPNKFRRHPLVSTCTQGNSTADLASSPVFINSRAVTITYLSCQSRKNSSMNRQKRYTTCQPSGLNTTSCLSWISTWLSDMHRALLSMHSTKFLCLNSAYFGSSFVTREMLSHFK